MTDAIKQFMNGIIDYAGLFPPAKLPFKEAFSNYLNYRDENFNWMLSKFILPASLIHKINAYDDTIRKRNQTIPFSLLLSYVPDTVSALAKIKKELKLARDLKIYFQGLVSTDSIELRIPNQLTDSPDIQTYLSFLEALPEEIITSDIRPVNLFVETDLNDDCEDSIEAFSTALAEFNKKNLPFTFGFKLRCGGVTADLFPTVKQVAMAIESAAKHALSMKFTAGLHHPIRHYNTTVNTKMFGFFNIFFGAALYYHHLIDTDDLYLLLSDENPDSFQFQTVSASWNQIPISLPQIIDARDNFAIAYGSCSFQEPIEDLRELNLF